jgi:hypothetical protein
MSSEDKTGKPRLLAVAERLQKHGVEFMVIGGQAAVLLGSPIATFDIDQAALLQLEALKRLREE